jgi:hypothetical protein
MTASLIGVSLPTFLIGIALIWIFAVELQWLPSNGRGEVVAIWGLDNRLFDHIRAAVPDPAGDHAGALSADAHHAACALGDAGSVCAPTTSSSRGRAGCRRGRSISVMR